MVQNNFNLGTFLINKCFLLIKLKKFELKILQKDLIYYLLTSKLIKELNKKQLVTLKNFQY
jgi:hypothetical protein